MAARLHDHFARIQRAADPGGPAPATVPDRDTIEALLDAAFWASLRREEGYVPRISLAYLSPGQTPHPLCLAQPLPLRADALVRVAPAVEGAGIHLGVWPDEAGRLSVWGMTRPTPPFCFVLEVAAPGLLVVKYHRGDAHTKFVNVAVLEGDQVKVVDERASSLPDCPALLASLLGFDAPGSWADAVNLLVQLAVSMRAHGRGGLLLVVPRATEAWRDSIVQPLSYAVTPAFSQLAHLMREELAAREHDRWHEELDRAVTAVAGLTAVDGATIITDDYQVLAFGAKISRRRGAPPVEQVMVTEPIEGSVASTASPAQLGGTRHLSAAQFALDQKDGVALVASQDGRFTIFAWSPCEEMVHAHRVEALLL